MKIAEVGYLPASSHRPSADPPWMKPRPCRPSSWPRECMPGEGLAKARGRPSHDPVMREAKEDVDGGKPRPRHDDGAREPRFLVGSVATRQSPSQYATGWRLLRSARNDRSIRGGGSASAGHRRLSRNRFGFNVGRATGSSKNSSPSRHCAIPLSPQLSAHRTQGRAKHERHDRDHRPAPLSARTPRLRDDQPDQRLHARHAAGRGAGDPHRHHRHRCRRGADPGEGRQAARLLRPPRQGHAISRSSW